MINHTVLLQHAQQKDPKNRVDVRTRPLTDFIDFLGSKSVLFSWPLWCFMRSI
jgi:hypothetical protein